MEKKEEFDFKKFELEAIELPCSAKKLEGIAEKGLKG